MNNERKLRAALFEKSQLPSSLLVQNNQKARIKALSHLVDNLPGSQHSEDGSWLAGRKSLRPRRERSWDKISVIRKQLLIQSRSLVIKP